MIEDKRDYLFDNAKGLLISLVVFGHFLNLEQYPYTSIRVIYTFIYLFHMPAFIFISGYFSKNIDKCREVAIRNYFVPYVLLTVVTYIQIILLSYGPRPSFNVFSPAAGLWYLFVLVVYKMLLPDVNRLRKSLFLLFFIGLGAGFSHEFTSKFSLQRLMVFFFFFILGYKTSSKQIEHIRKYPCYLSIGVIGIVAWLSYILNHSECFKVSLLYGKLYYRDSMEGFDLAIRVLFYITGVTMTFVLLQIMTSKPSIFTKIGKNSFSVYVIHLFIRRWMDQAMLEQDIVFVNVYIYIVFVVIITCLTVFVCSRNVISNRMNQIMELCNKMLFRSE